MTTTAVESELLNGVNLPVLRKLLNDVKHDGARGKTEWGVTTRWAGGAVTETEVTGFGISGTRVKRSFRFRTDEPRELAGTNEFANPQEYLLGAFNACMVVGYVAVASLFGIALESLEIETEGEIDLRGFLGLDPNVKAGYEELHYTVRVKGAGTEAQLREIHEIVMKTSPNRYNISQPIKLTSELVIG
jgi:uncharacterized OsmC-like protein